MIATACAIFCVCFSHGIQKLHIFISHLDVFDKLPQNTLTKEIGTLQLIRLFGATCLGPKVLL
jgi:hypothetical protein